MMKHETEQEYMTRLVHAVIILHWQRKKEITGIYGNLD